MKSVIVLAIALTALVATASPAKAQMCVGEGLELCGFVWNDINGDGIQNDDADMDESNGDQSALDGVKVFLYVWDATDSTWDLVSDTETSGGGFFNFFGNIPDGQYKVVVEAPPGTAPTLKSQGSDNSIDSDAVPDTGGGAAQVCLGLNNCPNPNLPPVSSQELDFGFHTTGKVSHGTGTPGYWKKHPEEWPSATIVIGGRTYTVSQAIGYMGKVSKDKTISLFSQLVAAKLNVGIGNEDACIKARITEADNWMKLHPVGSNVAASSDAWQDISAAHTDLDDYNNGRLCAPHRN